MTRSYRDYVISKTHIGSDDGFEPVWMPPRIFPFQEHLVEWALRKGRAAIFADCGLGKTLQQLAWAENVARHTGGRVLVLCPLAVGGQTIREGEKFGIECSPAKHGELARIAVANYERLHHFNPSDWDGVVLDESSILKSFDGKTRTAIVTFLRKVRYRLLCTATAAPNDFTELGNSAEALGYMGYMDMLSRYFKALDSNNVNPRKSSGKSKSSNGKYRFKGHAEPEFWRFVAHWARAVQRPSDLGFSDAGYELPELDVETHEVAIDTPPEGLLFSVPARSLKEQRSELRRTAQARCALASSILDTERPGIAWCHTNLESSLLSKGISDSVEIVGSMTVDEKEARLRSFLDGDSRVLVTKPTVAGFGVNMQHCNHMTFFPSHSYEQWHQAVRRCHRFGQDKQVRVDVISTPGLSRVSANLEAKAAASDAMFRHVVRSMSSSINVPSVSSNSTREVPSWLTN